MIKHVLDKIINGYNRYMDKSREYQPKISISGVGVLHVSSAEILKTDEAKRQIQALSKLKLKKRPISDKVEDAA